jgi:hypothetical protein
VFPDRSLIAAQIVRVFGDDSILSLDMEFRRILDDGFLAGIFARFGMKLKYLYGGVDYPIDKMQFLGFTFTQVSGHWFPLYDVVRLATSYCYESVTPCDREGLTSKLFTLTLMSFPSPEYENFKSAYKQHLLWLTRQDRLTIVEQKYLSIGNLSNNELLALYLGTEGSDSLIWWLEEQNGCSLRDFSAF